MAKRIDMQHFRSGRYPVTLKFEIFSRVLTEREDPRDALVVRYDLAIADSSIAGLGSAAIVGTSSPRRLAQLKYLRSDLRISELRGNVDTRLRKLADGDAAVLRRDGSVRSRPVLLSEPDFGAVRRSDGWHNQRHESRHCDQYRQHATAG